MSPSTLTTSGLTACCPACVLAIEPRLTRCPECEDERPPAGWPTLYDCPYPYLGRLVEGRYLIDRFLDSGASGHVYRARGLRIRRQFAIKMVDTGRYRDPARRRELIARFQGEVETLSALKNPHTVAVYEAVTISEEVLGLVMEYIDGPTLEEFLEEEGPLELEQALNILSQIANGLHEAHQKDIIHRDIKPENIMLERLPAVGYFARILDFGIAQIGGSTGQTQGFRGSPLYASPEQCQGIERLDRRSDIYSLGCLLYFMLTGQPPFAFGNALQVMDAHLSAPRPRLAEAQQDTHFPEEIENLVANMLSIDRDDRPRDLHLLHQDLSRFLQGQPMRHFGVPPAQSKKPQSGDDDDAQSPWRTQRTPPVTQFINLNERTSAELGQESSIIADSPASSVPQTPHLTLLLERSLPPQATGSTITAAAMDCRGLICALADHSPQTYFLELSEDAEFLCVPGERITTALGFDLSRGVFLSADIKGALSTISPFAGLERQITTLTRVPLTLQFIPDTQRLYYGTERGELFVHDLRTSISRELSRFPHAISALDLDPGASTALVGLWDGSIARHNMSGALQWHLPIAPDTIAHMGALDGERYFAMDHKGTLYIGDLEYGELLSQTMIGPGLRSLRRLTDGRIFGLSVFEDILQIWQLIIHP